MGEIIGKDKLSVNNWESIFKYQLDKYYQDVMTGMKTDLRLGFYEVLYSPSVEDEERADGFARIIHYLIEDKYELNRIVRKLDGKIDWG